MDDGSGLNGLEIVGCCSVAGMAVVCVVLLVAVLRAIADDVDQRGRDE